LLLVMVYSYPSPHDFITVSYLIPSTFWNSTHNAVTGPVLRHLSQCMEFLNSCQYAQFWRYYHQYLIQDEAVPSSSTAAAPVPDPRIAALAPQLIPVLRRNILQVLALSYRQAPLTVVQTALDTQDVAPFRSDAVVDKVTETTVVFVATPDNTPRQKVYEESVHYSSIRSLLSRSQ
jgi:hypothetical protein